MERLTKFPVVENGYHAVLSVIAAAREEGRLGYDLEYSEVSGPTIIGVGSRHRAAAAGWNPLLGRAVLDAGVPISAYAGIGADKPVSEKALGVNTPLDLWEDPMLKHYIVRPDLASVAKSTYGEDRDDAHVMGMMNLWVATSLLHDLPNWKRCLSELDSSGQPVNAALAEICVSTDRACPVHKPFDYCALDAWCGLVDDYALDEQMAVLGIPREYYEWTRKKAFYCWRMQWDPERGLEVDRETAEAIDEAIRTKKNALFPARFVWDGKEREKKTGFWRGVYSDGSERRAEKRASLPKVGTGVNGAEPPKLVSWEKLVEVSRVPGPRLKKPRVVWEAPFNPNSPQAALAWFAQQGILLRDRGGKPSMAKPILLAVLERRLRPYGLALDPQTGVVGSTIGDDADDVTLPYELDMLVRLGQKTILGKGLKSWVNTDYIYNGRFRPRFIVTGTSTSRLSSAKINAQNIPARGFGVEVRKIIVARPGFCLVKADASQLEFRVMLWLAGKDPALSDGAFEQLVTDSAGKFEAAAKLNNMKPRDISKSAVHAGDYAEGLKLLTERELSATKLLADRGAGALVVYDGRDGMPLWTFRGRVVCFTGANLAERLFGNRTREARARANEIQQVFFNRFPAIRELQMKITRDIEDSYEVRLRTGHRVELYGRTPEDDIKYALALSGQGHGAVYINEGLLRFGAAGVVVDLQVHDEVLLTSHIRPEVPDDEVLRFMLPLVQESRYMPGFSCPAKVARSLGPGVVMTGRDGQETVVKTHNWKETRELGTIRVDGR